MNDQIYLQLQLEKAKAGILSGKVYYYPVPTFEKIGGVVVRMTDDRARELFLEDKDGYKKLLADRPAGCSNWINFGDLIVPIPDELPTQATVLRVAHELNPDGSFTILAELKNQKPGDKAYVQVMGLAGTGWSQTGKYVMAAQVQQYPAGSGTIYSWSKNFTGLKKGDSVEYRVYANDRLDFLSGTIVVENANASQGPVWGAWKPGKITPGMGYSGQLPEDAATGTGTVFYFLLAGPSWFSYAQNTRNFAAFPTPSEPPSPPATVTFRAQDEKGISDKQFTLEFTGQLDLFMGVGFDPAGTNQLYIGIGPDEPLGFTVKMTALSPGTVWTRTSAYTALHQGIGVNGLSYPYRQLHTAVPVGTFLIQVVRLRDGQTRYAQFVQDGNAKQLTIEPAETPPPYTAPGFKPEVLGDVWELVKDEETVVTKVVLLSVPQIREGNNLTAVFYERLSPSNTLRKYARPCTWSFVFSRGAMSITPAQNDPATVLIDVPLGSVFADEGFVVKVVDDDSGAYFSPTFLVINVDPEVPVTAKPVRQKKADDIYFEGNGAKSWDLPTDWFSPAGDINAYRNNGTTDSALPTWLVFRGDTVPPRLEASEQLDSCAFPIRFPCVNAGGEAQDLINFQLKRVTSVGKITSIWTGFDQNRGGWLVWLFGDLLGNNMEHRVRWRLSPTGAWALQGLIAFPTVDFSPQPQYYLTKNQGTTWHVEFQVYHAPSGAAVGPVVALDYSFPATTVIQSPQRVYSA